MELYHGTSIIIHNNKIDLDKSRDNLDFARGFYLSDKKELAKLWAAQKKFKTHVINIYNLNKSSLVECNLGFDIQWLIFVIYNRFKNNRYYKDCINRINEEIKEDIENIENSDLIIGPIIDSGFHNIIEAVLNGYINVEEAITLLTMYTTEYQYVLKNKKSIESLEYIKYESLSQDDAVKLINNNSRSELYKKTSEYIYNAMDKKDKNGYIPNKEEIIEEILKEYIVWKEVYVNA